MDISLFMFYSEDVCNCHHRDEALGHVLQTTQITACFPILHSRFCLLVLELLNMET